MRKCLHCHKAFINKGFSVLEFSTVANLKKFGMGMSLCLY